MLSFYALQRDMLSACPEMHGQGGFSSFTYSLHHLEQSWRYELAIESFVRLELTLSAMLETWWPQAVLEGLCGRHDLASLVSNRLCQSSRDVSFSRESAWN